MLQHPSTVCPKLGYTMIIHDIPTQMAISLGKYPSHGFPMVFPSQKKRSSRDTQSHIGLPQGPPSPGRKAMAGTEFPTPWRRPAGTASWKNLTWQ